MNSKSNIILCGFMGCGKTSAGKLLAERVDATFIDMDDYIEEREGMTISEIFKQFGEAVFREREHEAVLELAKTQGIVLATGGGALTFERNVNALRPFGSIVFLNLGFDECYRRIEGTERPLVMSKTRKELEMLYNSRVGQYSEAADFTLVPSGSPDRIAEDIAKLLGL